MAALLPNLRMRRWLGRGLLYAFAWMCLGSAALVAAVALISRLATDRTLLTQYLFWAPLAGYAALMSTCVSIAALCTFVDRLWKRARQPVHTWKEIAAHHRPLCRALLLLALACIATSVLAWRDLTTPLTLTPPRAPGEIRVLHWNLSSPDTHTWPGVITDIPECRDADVMLLGVTMSDEQFARVLRPLAQTHHIRRIHTLAVISRFPIQDVRSLDLQLDAIVRPARADGSAPEPWYQTIYNNHAEQLGISRREFGLSDPGDIIAFTVLTPAGPARFWFIDLPSNPFASRRAIARAASKRAADAGLAPSHVVMGDFNMPRGSHSIDLIAPGYHSAADRARDRASGPTWPRARPLIQIDHALVQPGCAIHVYRTFDPGLSDHWGQFLTFSLPAPASSESVGPAR